MERRRFLEWAAAAALMAPGGPGFARAPRSFDPQATDAAAMALALRRGQVTAAQLVATSIARLERVNPALNAAPHLYLADARAAAGKPAAGPLGGLPTFTKDIAEERGRAFTQGARAFARRVGAADAPPIAAIRRAGLIPLGRTAVPEFGLLPTTEPLLGGPTRNPWNPAHSAGGSSGGSAALVAAGVVPFAHATDGGGSIRIPASVNGLVGLKPSRGRMAGQEGQKGVTALSVSGCVSRTVRDTAAWLAAHEARRGPYPPVGLVTGPGRRALRIGLRLEGLGGPPAADVVAVFERAERLLRSLGMKLVTAPAPFDLPRVSAAFTTLWGAGAARDVGRTAAWLGRPPGPDDLEPATFGFAGLAGSPEAVAAAVRTLEDLPQRYLAQFDSYDVLMTPVLGGPPPPLGHLAPTVAFETLLARLAAYVGYTPIENAAGAPAIALPLGLSSAGLPIGLQFAAPPGGERRLLELAYTIEQAQPWAHHRPKLWAA